MQLKIVEQAFLPVPLVICLEREKYILTVRTHPCLPLSGGQGKNCNLTREEIYLKILQRASCLCRMKEFFDWEFTNYEVEKQAGENTCLCFSPKELHI